MRVTTQNGRVVLGDDQAAPRVRPFSLRHMSDAEMKALGLEHIAYVKAVRVDGEAAFAIHAADGTPMALAGDQETAFGAILEHEMVPALVH
ncbi:DUF1150 family protein [Ameyamaea chiangmaiensis]|uniref:DUF1150 family protein n=1 Tax=Ameyamaea chiangmaiensis TaxID=442969 RepID=A0A850PCP2_9PROT|nr:DUF1150 family protein [Ameyamaea chiangmaiensis]MBS4075531.1 DUF1150 family protein [Ameyamaea chiangmaiensis]NVN41748.1 DUF1150 family protein [Ameyamaea chiangmaiensis]